jgi:hypothetical protein
MIQDARSNEIKKDKTFELATEDFTYIALNHAAENSKHAVVRCLWPIQLSCIRGIVLAGAETASLTCVFVTGQIYQCYINFIGLRKGHDKFRAKY